MVPDLPVHWVSRPRLLSVLDQAHDAIAALICAPAGCGKTLLLAEWAHRRGTAETAWVALDSDDNDDRRFWSAVLDALAACPGIPAESPLRTLDVPPLPSTDLAFLAEVVDALDELPGPVVLVLDDLHEINDPQPLRGLQVLVRQQPAGLRLVLSSRCAPELPLARLRLADQLVEMRVEELKFSLAEARALFAVAGATVSPDGLHRLVDETEGWAVGLRLAAASAVRHGDLDEFVAGHDRALLEYLTDEVLSHLAPGTREFLRAISVDEEVSVGLAGALSGRADAGVALHELGEQALVAAPHDATRRQYRVPALLRSYLLAELSRQEPDRVAALHSVAADWFAAEGEPARALTHCTRARDSERVVALLRQHAVALFLAGEHTVLRRALAVLDDRLISADALLALVIASLCLEAGEPGTADLHLAHADATWPDRPSAELEVLRQLAHSQRAQIEGDVAAIALAAAGVDTQLAEETAFAALAVLHRVVARLLSGGAGGEVREQLTAILVAAEDGGQRYVAMRCLIVLGALAAVEGDVRLMTTFARRVDTRNQVRGWQRTIEAASAGVLLTYGALLRAEPGECVREATRVTQLFDDAPPRTTTNLCLVAEILRGAAEFELGEWHAGLRRMQKARTAMGDTPFSPQHAALSGLLEHRAALLLGAGDEARGVLHWGQEALAQSGELLLMRARAQLALGRQGSAENLLQPLLNGEVPTVLPWTVIEALLVGVQATADSGEPDRARKLLEKALSTADRTGAWYPLVFAPPEVIAMLTSQLGRLGISERIAGQILARRRRLSTPPIPAPLTERERSVLRLLPTLRSIDEIAEDLTVSPNTVKTHVRGIYAKLAVRRRRDAVAIALTQGLLDAEVTDFTG
jgi:LuxR family maltose regulon positive regulatory protein